MIRKPTTSLLIAHRLVLLQTTMTGAGRVDASLRSLAIGWANLTTTTSRTWNVETLAVGQTSRTLRTDMTMENILTGRECYHCLRIPCDCEKPSGNSHCPASAGSVLTLRFNDGTERDYNEADFNRLKASGMLWEFHPDAPMDFPSQNRENTRKF